MAKQTVEQADTFGEAYTKLNENDTELYNGKAVIGVNSDITSMTGLDDDGIPLTKVANAAKNGANADITSMTGLTDDGIPLAKVAGAAVSGANDDITSLTGLDGSDVDLAGGYLTNVQNIPDMLAGRGSGYWFDGVDDYISVGSVADTNFADRKEWSIITALNENGSSGGCIYLGDTGASSFLSLLHDTGYLSFRMSNTEYATFPLTSITDGKESIVSWVCDGSNLSAFINGKQPDSAQALVASDINVTQIGMGYNSDNAFGGTMNRTLIFNLALSAEEVKALSFGAPVPYKYIGASQIPLIEDDCTDDSTSDWYEANCTITFDTDHYVLTVGSDNAFTQNGPELIVGKSTLGIGSVYLPSSNTTVDKIRVRIGSTGGNYITTTDTWIDVSETVEPSTEYFYIIAMAGNGATGLTAGDEIWFKDITLTQIGCVLDLNPSGITTTEWIDQSGNDLHGTVSGAIATNDIGIAGSKTTTAGDTGLLLYDATNGQYERVTVGTNDSGGSGYKVLRIPN